MPNKTTMSSLFPHQMTAEVFNKVTGHSSLAKLAGTMPVSQSGTDIMTFALDGEVAIVGEGGQKPAGAATFATVSVAPVKVVYQHRVSDEFLRAAEERQLAILEQVTEGFAKKIARGLDIMAMHGLNPATLTASDKIGTNHLDTCQKVVYAAGEPETALTGAVEALGDFDNTGFVLSKTLSSAMGQYKEAGVSQYPEFKLGANPGTLNGIACDVNSTVNKGAATVLGYVGDFANAFRWGYADQIPMEVIQYGDPDGQGDLKRTNEVVLRCEAFIGWAIMDKKAFARITTA